LAARGSHGLPWLPRGRAQRDAEPEGLSASDIEAAMSAFRTGAREATVMDRIAKGFTEAESKAISAWLANAGAPR
jgi:cytochrome c553